SRKETPREHPSEDHQRVGRRTFRGQFGQLPEEDREHHHGQERSDDGPGRTDHGLFVANGDIAPSENLKEFAVTPQVDPIMAFGTATFYDEHVLAGRRRSMCGRRLAVLNRATDPSQLARGGHIVRHSYGSRLMRYALAHQWVPGAHDGALEMMQRLNK